MSAPHATSAARQADESPAATEATEAPPARRAAAPAGLAVRVEGLSLRFGERTALDGVSLDVPRGALFALLGPNGSGKSTLLRIVSTLLRPSAGRAWVEDLDVTAQAAAARHRLGVVFQAAGLDAKLTVAENLRFQGHLYGLSGRTLAERIDAALERFGLAERRGDRAGTLSGGLRRRVELARALLHRPRVLLLDEPSSGLDLPSRHALWEALTELRAQDGLTVLVATHLMEEADRCGHVALLDQGRLVALDTPAALKQALGQSVLSLESPDPAGLVRRLAEEHKLEAVVQGGAVHLTGGAEPALGPRLLAAYPEAITALRLGRPTLGDVFLARTGRTFAAERGNGDPS